MDDLDKELLTGEFVEAEKLPFTVEEVLSRYHFAQIRRQAQRRTRVIISGLALVGALIAFLFINMDGKIGPGFLDPTLVRAATPFPTMIVTPLPTLTLHP